MNSDIVSVANELVYSHKLKCGTQEVADSSLSVPQLEKVHSMHSNQSPATQNTSHLDSTPKCFGKCWLMEALSPM